MKLINYSLANTQIYWAPSEPSSLEGQILSRKLSHYFSFQLLSTPGKKGSPVLCRESHRNTQNMRKLRKLKMIKAFFTLNLYFSADWHLWILQPAHRRRRTSCMRKPKRLSLTSAIHVLTMSWSYLTWVCKKPGCYGERELLVTSQMGITIHLKFGNFQSQVVQSLSFQPVDGIKYYWRILCLLWVAQISFQTITGKIKLRIYLTALFHVTKLIFFFHVKPRIFPNSSHSSFHCLALSQIFNAQRNNSQ